VFPARLLSVRADPSADRLVPFALVTATLCWSPVQALRYTPAMKCAAHITLALYGRLIQPAAVC